MTESIYKEYENKYYNPNDNDKKPGDNDNWKSIQKGFHDIGSTQLETSAGLTLGKGTEDETSVTAGELEEIKNPTQLETSGGLTLGKGTEDETSVTPAELEEIKNPTQLETSGGLTLGKGTEDETSVTAAELKEIANSSVKIVRFSTSTVVNVQPNSKDYFSFDSAIPPLKTELTLLKENGFTECTIIPIITVPYAAVRTGVVMGNVYLLSNNATLVGGLALSDTYINTLISGKLYIENNTESGFTASIVLTLIAQK